MEDSLKTLPIGEKIRLAIVFIRKGNDVLIHQASVRVEGGNSLQIYLNNTGSPKAVRAMCILMILAKYQAPSFADLKGRLKFSVSTTEKTWIKTLEGIHRDTNAANLWYLEHFKLLPFMHGSRGGKHCYPFATYFSKLLPLEHLDLKVKNASEVDIPSLTRVEMEEFARKLDSRNFWARQAVDEFLDEVSTGRELEDSAEQGTKEIEGIKTVHGSPHLTQKKKRTTSKEISKELYYLLRNRDSERECLNFLERHSAIFSDFCNLPLAGNGDFPLLLAIVFEKTDVINFLLERPETNVNGRNRKHVTPLLKAASFNNINLIERLLERGANPLAHNKENANAIYESAFGATLNSYETIKLFEELGVKCSEPSRDGFLPLSVAIWRKCPRDTISHLMECADREGILGKKDKYGETLVYKAFKHDDFQTLTRLIKKMMRHGDAWMDIPELLPKNRGSELFQATHDGDVDHVTRLLQGKSKNFDVDDGEPRFQRSPLHEAAENKHLEITKLLLHHGADPFRQNNHGRTPRDLLPIDRNVRERNIEVELITSEQAWIKNEYNR